MATRITAADVTKVASWSTATYMVQGPKRAYWVDLAGGQWFCSCGHANSCGHVRLAKEVHG